MIQSRIDITTYRIRVESCTDKELQNNQKFLLTCPFSIIVNGIIYDATDVDQLFVDKTLINKRVMFIAHEIRMGKSWGEMYKLPFGVGRAIEVHQSNESQLKAS